MSREFYSSLFGENKTDFYKDREAIGSGETGDAGREIKEIRGTDGKSQY
jgi:hypothetical protein